MSQATAHTVRTGQIEAENGEYYPDDVYHETSRATGQQQWVADQWAEGALPIHSTSGNQVELYSGTRNFRGYQFPDGKGKLIHYSHIQAIRTKSGLILGDSSCYGRGWAHCNYPTDTDHRLDLTALKGELHRSDPTIYDIEAVDGSEVTFSNGAVFDMDSSEWVEGPNVTTPDGRILG